MKLSQLSCSMLSWLKDGYGTENPCKFREKGEKTRAEKFKSKMAFLNLSYLDSGALTYILPKVCTTF